MLATVLRTFIAVGALATASCAHSTTLQFDGRDWRLDQVVEGVIEQHRQMVVLADERDFSPEGRDALAVARVLSQRSRDRLGLLAQAIGGDTEAADALAAEVLKPTLHDGDRLAFYDVVLDLPATPRVQDAQERLGLIHQRYAAKLHELLQRVGVRGTAPPPEPWDDYAAFLRQRYDRPALLARYAPLLPEAPRTRSPGGTALPANGVVLAFESGPRPRRTDAVKSALARFDVQAVFVDAGQDVRRLDASIDALDWADPFPESIAARVVRQVAARQRGVVVFQSDARPTPEALSLVIERLRAGGYTFLDDERFIAGTAPLQNVYGAFARRNKPDAASFVRRARRAR
jgi:hypothetical protein